MFAGITGFRNEGVPGWFTQGALALALAGAYPATANAQTPADAGALRRQIEQDRTVPLPPRQQTLEADPNAPTAAPGGAQVQVSAFTFTGNTLIGSDELARVVAPWVGRASDLAGLQAAAAAVGEAYRSRGWVVRAQLPRQEVLDGVVRIEVVEGRLGKILVEGEQGGRIPARQAEAVAGAGLAPGEVLTTRALDRGLLLADDLPGVIVAGRLQPGAAPGETDLALQLAPEPLFSGNVGIDNYGVHSTGSERATASIALASPLGIGDLLGASLIHSQGSDYLRAEYSVPVGSQGLRLGVNGSLYRYDIVTAPFDALDAHGKSNSGGLQASFPIVRARNGNLLASANYDRRTFDNLASGEYVSRYGVDDITVALNGNLFDELGGGGANTFGLAVISSRVDLDGSPSQPFDAVGPQVEGTSTKLRLNLSRQQYLSDMFSLYGALATQLSDSNQDSSEKFYLGGPYGVRAYASDEGAGSNGTLVNLELRARLMKNLTATAFYDWGQVKVNVDNDYAGAPLLNRYSLKGAGLGLTWMADSGLTLRAIWARRIGENPNPTPDGRDQDGTKKLNRFWLSASLPF